MKLPSILEFKSMYTQKDYRTLFAWLIVCITPIIVYLINPCKFSSLTIALELPLLFIVLCLRADFELFWDSYKPISESLPNIGGEISEDILIAHYPNNPKRYIRKSFCKLIKEHKLILKDGKFYYCKV